MRGLALLLVPIAACSPSGERHGSAHGRGSELAAVVTIVSRGVGDCSIRWNGAPVSQQALLQHAVTVNSEALEALEKAMEEERRRYPSVHFEHDGDEVPDVRVEAARGLPYSCFGPALRILERAGSDVRLRPAGENSPDQKAYFADDFTRPARRYSTIVRLAAGGRMTWNGAAVDLDGLRRRVRAMATRTLDDVTVAPSTDADFITLYEAMRVIGQHNRMPTLSGCTGTVGLVRDPPIC
jgi:hypothetical protein